MKRKIFLFLFFLLISGTLILALVENNYPSEIKVSPFRIFYDFFDGDTTDFNSYLREDLYNLSDVVLEKTSYGKVEFNENLDLINMAGDDWILDFNQDFVLNSNALFVDLENLSGINKLATISFYNIDYEDPLIYHNGALCLNCYELSYSSGIFIFNVTSLSGLYYLRENPILPYCGDGVCNNGETQTTCPADCGTSGGGGGGGGGGTTPSQPSNETKYDPRYDFNIIPNLVEAEVRKGSYFRKSLFIENNGTSDLTLGIFVDELTQFIFPTTRAVSVKAGETKQVDLDIYVSEGVVSDLYLGKVVFTSSQISKFANVLLNVKESYVLFDIKTDILKKYINPGGRVRANVSLINMGDLRNFDVNLLYKIIDFDRNEYTIKEEQFAINRTYNNVFYLDVPDDIPIGNYIFHTVVKYEEVNATAYDTFTVEKLSFVSWIVLILIILLLMYLAYAWYKKRKRELIYGRRVKEEKKRKISDDIGYRNISVPDID